MFFNTKCFVFFLFVCLFVFASRSHCRIVLDPPFVPVQPYCFGNDVDRDGDVLVVGASGGRTTNGNVFVYRKVNADWVLEQTLSPTTNEEFFLFGRECAIDGNTIIVGAPGLLEHRGSVFVYEYDGSQWIQTQILQAPTQDVTDCFGWDVDIDNNTVVISDTKYASGNCMVYVFEKENGNFEYDQGLTLSWQTWNFGYRVVLKGDMLAISDIYYGGSDQGKVFIYNRDGSDVWTRIQQIAEPYAGTYDKLFGRSIDFNDDFLVLTRPLYRNTSAGGSYLFTNNNNVWEFTQKIQCPEPNLNDYFGETVAFFNNNLLLSNLDDKMAHVLSLVENEWIETYRFHEPQTANNYGNRMTFNEGTPIITDYSYNNDIGRVYIYDEVMLPGTYEVISLDPETPNVHRGQDIELTIKITDNISSNIVGYRAVLDLDPSKVTYVDGSATKEGTSTEIGWGPLVVNSASPELAIFTCASATGTLASGPASLMKFQLHVDESLADFTPISVTFNPLTSLNEDAVAFDAEIWSATVLGPNHQPTFTGGPDQEVLEDSGVHEIAGWATNIDPGSPYEDWQSLYFTLDVDEPQLFFGSPTLDATGTLRYTLATDEFGICNATAVLHDSGGTANGGIDSSTPYQFTITVKPVNDAPSFVAGATVVVLNATGGQHTIANWATDIIAGPVNESTQTLSFDVETDRPEIFSATPYIAPSGTLFFTPVAEAHGVVKATATLYDDGGIADGGINKSSPAVFVTKIYIPYLWGDLNDNDQAGSVDASTASAVRGGVDRRVPRLSRRRVSRVLSRPDAAVELLPTGGGRQRGRHCGNLGRLVRAAEIRVSD